MFTRSSLIRCNSRTLASLLLAAGAAGPAWAGTRALVCELLGTQEVPPNGSSGRGFGRFVIDRAANTLSYRIVFGNLVGPEVAAHIHGPAGPGINAAVVHPLPLGNPKIGVWNYPEAMEADILAGRMYVNIHSQNFPGGEIRGQINQFLAVLDGAQETPPAPTMARGWATLSIDTCANVLRYHIAFGGLSSPEVAAHIHAQALHTVAAAVVHPLPAGSPKVGQWNYPEALEEAILNGRTYINIHTQNFPAGEIRGQISNHVEPMDGQQEVPPVGTAANGAAILALNTATDQLSFHILYGSLSSNETAAHIHGFAPPGQNAGVIFPLPPGVPKLGIWNYPAANEAQILAGLTYANVHTNNFPGGEIRGQLLFGPADTCPGDLDCNGRVDQSDLGILLADWGCDRGPGNCPGDIDGDGDTDQSDLGILLGNWNAVCP